MDPVRGPNCRHSHVLASLPIVNCCRIAENKTTTTTTTTTITTTTTNYYYYYYYYYYYFCCHWEPHDSYTALQLAPVWHAGTQYNAGCGLWGATGIAE